MHASEPRAGGGEGDEMLYIPDTPPRPGAVSGSGSAGSPALGTLASTPGRLELCDLPADSNPEMEIIIVPA